jgi:hypothetical protein
MRSKTVVKWLNGDGFENRMRWCGMWKEGQKWLLTSGRKRFGGALTGQIGQREWGAYTFEIAQVAEYHGRLTRPYCWFDFFCKRKG